MLAALVIGVGALSGTTKPSSSCAGGFPAVPPVPFGASTAHTCWLDTNGQINGCRLADGVHGIASSRTITCYFEDEDFDAADSVRCDN